MTTADELDFFAESYEEARLKFLDAARAAGATLVAKRHPLAGPQGEELSLDLAILGPPAARRTLVTVSGTHGVEGYCGSACQVGALRTGLYSLKGDEGVRILVLHAANPWGFAHSRRVTEENVDLNRNFVDFAGPLPQNPAYDALSDALVPDALEGPARAEADRLVQSFIAEKGTAVFQAAIQLGQYRHPDGMFFGGTAPTWSRRTIESLLAEHLSGTKFLGVIEYHTGLGPRGVATLISAAAPGTPAFDDARRWYGEEVKLVSAQESNEVSARVQGKLAESFLGALPQGSRCVYVAPEYGTHPLMEVFGALQDDHILHKSGADLSSATAQRIKARLKEAFYPADPEWKLAVWQQSELFTRRALQGLAGE